MKLPQEGGCLCAAVRYRLTREPFTLYACHCTDCQTRSGSAFGLSMPCPAEAVEITRGRPERTRIDFPDGRQKDVVFCACCGVQLYGARPKLPGVVNLRPGTLDDRSWVRPVAHIWTRSARPWVPIPEDLPRFETRPEGPELLRAWKAEHGE